MYIIQVDAVIVCTNMHKLNLSSMGLFQFSLLPLMSGLSLRLAVESSLALCSQLSRVLTTQFCTVTGPLPLQLHKLLVATG